MWYLRVRSVETFLSCVYTNDDLNGSLYSLCGFTTHISHFIYITVLVILKIYRQTQEEREKEKKMKSTAVGCLLHETP